jgi:TRAP-type mannitol/chloroaromatic compound transport system substrate-binding protein
MRILKPSLKRLTAIAAATTVLFAFQGAHAAEPEHTFKMATGWSGGPLATIGAEAFAKNLDQLTDGRIKVQVFTGGALGNALKVSETVKNGVAEMGHTWMGYDWGKDSATVLFAGYPGSPDSERMLHWLYEGGGVELQREFREEKFGVISFPLFMRTAEVFLHSRKPVRTLEDLKGLKLRTAGAWLEMAQSLGAAPVTTPGGDVYPMLERGAIDATEWGTPWENVSPGFHKVAKYVIIPGVHQPVAPFELVVNQKAWAKLSDKDKQAVETAAKLTTLNSWMRIGQEDAKALELFEANGNEIIELDPEVQYRTQEIAKEWAEKQAANNEWFARVYQQQEEFKALWKDADAYRDVKVRE